MDELSQLLKQPSVEGNDFLFNNVTGATILTRK
jgi:hypothetical protein